VHLFKGTFYCLPDDYEIHDGSLSDISAALHPTFASQEISKIDSNTGLARDLFGRRYLPGYVGLNNLHKTDCVNAIVQALVHVRPLRDFFLSRTHQDITIPSKKNKPPHRMSHLAQCFGELVRKIWSDKRFKSHVDPHMLIQAISEASKKRFRVGLQAEAGEFLSWFLNTLHIGLGGSRKPGSSIIYKCFQGKVEMTTRQRKLKNNDVEKKDDEGNETKTGQEDTDESMSETRGEVEIEETTIESNFLQLTLDIPEKPLFRDDEGGLVIPQEPLVTVLKKFDGISFSDALSKSGVAQRKRYVLRELPPYLILHLSRFNSNRYSREKNPTIVAFPVKNLDLGSYTFPKNGKDTPPTEEEVRKMDVRSTSRYHRVPIMTIFSPFLLLQVKELKDLLSRYGRGDVARNAIEKKELVESAVDFVTKSLPELLADKYDLVANITHESPADVGREGKIDPLQEGSYKCHVQHKASNQWYEMQDLHVQEIMPQLIGVSESYVLIFERKSAQMSFLDSN
jgi:U4/U6.U5 tri-snRNP-associated protein 2